MWRITLPDRIFLKVAIASACDKPARLTPFTDTISSPTKKKTQYVYRLYISPNVTQITLIDWL